jgi:hypothetical protein
MPSDFGRTFWAGALRQQFITADFVPVANNQFMLTIWAKSGVALKIVHVAGIDEMQASIECDAAGSG